MRRFSTLSSSQGRAGKQQVSHCSNSVAFAEIINGEHNASAAGK